MTMLERGNHEKCLLLSSQRLINERQVGRIGKKFKVCEARVPPPPTHRGRSPLMAFSIVFIRILEEDLESEQGLRRRVEREKHELQGQIIVLSERLTEAEGGAESQLDINRKREAEMAKLRKLLEDVHTESEQQIHILRKKHQEAMMELQVYLS